MFLLQPNSYQYWFSFSETTSVYKQRIGVLESFSLPGSAHGGRIRITYDGLQGLAYIETSSVEIVKSTLRNWYIPRGSKIVPPCDSQKLQITYCYDLKHFHLTSLRLTQN